MTNYNDDTRLAYRETSRAREYRRYHTSGITWIRLMMHIERQIIKKWLGMLGVGEHSWILDLPCGTGLLAPVLAPLNSHTLAADISVAMMRCAGSDYAAQNFLGFTAADATALPFKADTFDGVIMIGLLHRLPEDVRRAVIAEICRVSKDIVLVSVSIDSLLQRAKRLVLGATVRSYKPAPAPARLDVILAEFRAAGFDLAAKRATVPVLSADTLLLLRKRA